MANEPAEVAETTREGFVRGLGLLDSTMIVAGSMIGSGIFIVSADIARQVGSPGWLLVVWIITGLLTVGAALSYGELAAMMPKAGGMYVYLKEAYAPFWGFLYGWTHFLVIGTATIAAVSVASPAFLYRKSLKAVTSSRRSVSGHRATRFPFRRPNLSASP
jgi:basic amino acid/polyamine antiporter, APA family